ncbi:hypothetical protein PIB19_18625 [Sphingomonas sp. 7/4-4]|uniref:hypothetical protein n=1 Tax=Sphingomonas sp. 7/4-4 TaxID=3018446 RepID=UPI0022F38210|nr:hypothetical protein [Sphingomonas sp. 7/4-4]WBY07355.1 hypothetical protein PIB19_18625 [Sphingomonas sp. 7/4-4]
MNKLLSIAAAGAALLAGGCTTTSRNAPVEVTRYHIGTLSERTTVAIEPMTGAAQISPEFQMYADAVGTELERLGFVQSRSEMASGYIAAVSFTRVSRGAYREQPPSRSVSAAAASAGVDAAAESGWAAACRSGSAARPAKSMAPSLRSSSVAAATIAPCGKVAQSPNR